MKKYIYYVLTLLLLLTMTACNESSKTDQEVKAENSFKVSVTIPQKKSAVNSKSFKTAADIQAIFLVVIDNNNDEESYPMTYDVTTDIWSVNFSLSLANGPFTFRADAYDVSSPNLESGDIPIFTGEVSFDPATDSETSINIPLTETEVNVNTRILPSLASVEELAVNADGSRSYKFNVVNKQGGVLGYYVESVDENNASCTTPFFTYPDTEVTSINFDSVSSDSSSFNLNYTTQANCVNPVHTLTLTVEETGDSINIPITVDDQSFNISIAFPPVIESIETTQIDEDYEEVIRPIITLNGESNITILQGVIYADAGAIAIDSIDGDITENIVTSNPVDTTTLGTYIVTYNVSNTVSTRAIEVIRRVNVVKDNNITSLIILENLLERATKILDDDSIPYITEADFNKTEYAKNQLSVEDSKKITRVHQLVATAIDPDPEWFMTEVDQMIRVVEAGEDYTVKLKKTRKDNTVIGPVDNDRLRLVVKIQRGKNDFEYVTNNNISDYVIWDGAGVLKVHVPDDLENGRLLIGVRPNFDDVATNAIAARWSTMVIAEVWTVKDSVENVKEEDVIYPLLNKPHNLHSTSKFTITEVIAEIEKYMSKSDLILYPLIVEGLNLEKDDLVAYMIKGKPHSGRVVKVIEKDEQQFLFLAPELFDIYNIMDAEEGFLRREGLYPKNMSFREGERLVIDNNESDSTTFSKQSQKLEKRTSFSDWFKAECEIGKSSLIISPKMKFSPSLDFSLDTSIIALSAKTKCSWKTNDKGINGLDLKKIIPPASPAWIIMRLMGIKGNILPLGVAAIEISDGGAGLGISSHNTEIKFVGFNDTTLATAGSLNLEDKKSKFKIKFILGAGGKLILKILDYSEYCIIQGFEDIPLTNSDKKYKVTFETKIQAAISAEMKNSTGVYEDNTESKFVTELNLILKVVVGKKLDTILKYLKIPLEAKAEAVIELLAPQKFPIRFNYESIEDEGNGQASLGSLQLESNFLRHFLDVRGGVMAPIDKNRLVFNTKTDNIFYDTQECVTSSNYTIKVPAIACAWWFCGKVIEPISLCVGKSNYVFSWANTIHKLQSPDYKAKVWITDGTKRGTYETLNSPATNIFTKYTFFNGYYYFRVLSKYSPTIGIIPELWKIKKDHPSVPQVSNLSLSKSHIYSNIGEYLVFKRVLNNNFLFYSFLDKEDNYISFKIPDIRYRTLGSLDNGFFARFTNKTIFPSFVFEKNKIYPRKTISEADEHYGLTNVNNSLLYFIKNHKKGQKTLWKADSLGNNNQILKEMDIRVGVGEDQRVVMNSNLYFDLSSMNSTSLWKSDGTSDGTKLVKEFYQGNNDRKSLFHIKGLKKINNKIIFLVTGQSGYPRKIGLGGLWISDGTTEGTVQLKSFDVFYNTNVAIFKNKYYFFGTDGELWASDTTKIGTKRIKILRSSDWSRVPYSLPTYPFKFTVNNGLLFFRMKAYRYDKDTGSTYKLELWRSDGTENGTFILTTASET